jgi:uncharacterized membrane protein
MERRPARSPRKFEEPPSLWGYVVAIVGTALLSGFLGLSYSGLLALIFFHLPLTQFGPLLFVLVIFGASVIIPLAFLLSVPLVLFSKSRYRLAVSLIMILVTGVVGSYLFQTAAPFDLYHEADGSRPGAQAFLLLSRTTAVALLATLATVLSLSRLTRNFTP